MSLHTIPYHSIPLYVWHLNRNRPVLTERLKQMAPILHIAVRAARRAGKTLLRYAQRVERVAVTKVTGEGFTDWQSEIDRTVFAEISDAIRTRYPKDTIRATEFTAANSESESDSDSPDHSLWLIDPLDGTLNYLRGHPQFAVGIAVQQGGQLQHAVIFDPLRDELYVATRGQGAQLNNRRIRVSTYPRTKLPHALLASDFGTAPTKDARQGLKTTTALNAHGAHIRASGCAALELAYVACGRLDGYWQSGLAPWQLAPGALLVREAGGLTTDFHGRQGFLQNGQIVAANPALFTELISALGNPNAKQNGKAAKQ